jgi:hypothetical protein
MRREGGRLGAKTGKRAKRLTGSSDAARLQRGRGSCVAAKEKEIMKI